MKVQTIKVEKTVTVKEKQFVFNQDEAKFICEILGNCPFNTLPTIFRVKKGSATSYKLENKLYGLYNDLLRELHN